MTSPLGAPHGGTLQNRLVPAAGRADFEARAKSLPAATLTPTQACDLEMIGIGAYSPLTGFLGEADHKAVVETMRLASGLPWSTPVTLGVAKAAADGLAGKKEIALKDEQGRLLGTMEVTGRYAPDRENEAVKVFKTAERAHPGVDNMLKAGEVYLAGSVQVLERMSTLTGFTDHRLDPAETRKVFAERGWRTVVGFQTRNPVHRAHEYIQKCALEIVDGLLLHPLVGETKKDDIPADVRMKCYLALLEKYYPANRTLLAVLPAPMRYAGPREAIHHALMRKNYGCTHFIVGRDHAGVGKYYGTYDAQKIFESYAPGELGIQTLNFDNTFFCRACGGMASAKTCPHDASQQVSLSGTAVRDTLSKGQLPPPEFSRAEVAQVLMAYYQSLGK